MNKILVLLATLATGNVLADDATVKALQLDYQTKGVRSVSADAGKAMWTREFANEGEQRSCATCHTSDLRQGGKHASTGKAIKPLAPSVNNERLTRKAEVEKWFSRNCKWTLGRACTPQEKGDFLAYIASQ